MRRDLWEHRAVSGWSSLFASAFTQSRNAMILVDDQRRVVDVNGACLRMLDEPRRSMIGEPLYRFVVDGPRASEGEWRAMLASGHFTGVAEMQRADGTRVAVQWAASTERVTGRQLVLFVALGTSRWGRRFRRDVTTERAGDELTPREREIVMLVALGGTAREIADELHISHDTVRTHVRNAMEKLHARSRAHLVAKALSAGLVLE
jgi:DNA-binding CsgD family transcriptional regulator